MALGPLVSWARRMASAQLPRKRAALYTPRAFAPGHPDFAAPDAVTVIIDLPELVPEPDTSESDRTTAHRAPRLQGLTLSSAPEALAD